MASQNIEITLFYAGLNELIGACEFRIQKYKDDMKNTQDEDMLADMINDCCVLDTVLDVLRKARTEWEDEINEDIRRYKEQNTSSNTLKEAKTEWEIEYQEDIRRYMEQNVSGKPKEKL